MNKIFVSIACFMDKDIINTINDCIEKAVNPENLIFGICLQYDPDDDFFKKYDNNPQFKIIKMNWKEAKGPAYARGLIYELFSNENYFFQLDCHTRFFSNWDINLINCLSECKKLNEKSIISHYPININNMNDMSSLKHIANISTVRCIDSQLGIKTHGRYIDINNTPKESWGISAAMLFFDRQAYIDVPFDKEIYHGLQFEEQVVLAARYWTHGYNIYTPTKHIIATEYISNSSRFKERPPINSLLKKETYNRLLHIMKLKYDNDYALCNPNYIGKNRTIQDYYKFMGIFDKVEDIFTCNYLYYNKPDPKILILILSSDGTYEEMSKLSEKTWLSNIDKYKNMQYKFYYGKNKTNNKDKNKIFTSHDEIRSKILNKTIDAFKYVDKKFDYDYILRLCACSYVDLNKLNNFAKIVGNTRIFSGPFNNTSSGADKRYNLKREPFITGANIFLSNDVVKYLIENEHFLDYENYGPADDLNISMVINKHYIHKDNWLNQSWIKLNDSSKKYCEKIKNNKHYHYHYDHRTFKDQLLEFHKNY